MFVSGQVGGSELRREGCLCFCWKVKGRGEEESSLSQESKNIYNVQSSCGVTPAGTAPWYERRRASVSVVVIVMAGSDEISG